jgi:hypothetical protein
MCGPIGSGEGVRVRFRVRVRVRVRVLIKYKKRIYIERTRTWWRRGCWKERYRRAGLRPKTT